MSAVRTAAIIVSAGMGKRFGAAKHEALLAGRPVLEWSLEAFHSTPEIGGIALVLRDTSRGEALRLRFPKIISVVPGGTERQDSVRAGFQELEPGGWDVVLVHDGVRPLADGPLIRRVIEAAAATQIHDNFTFLEGCYGNRVAATETQVGPIRNTAHILGRVAEER